MLSQPVVALLYPEINCTVPITSPKKIAASDTDPATPKAPGRKSPDPAEGTPRVPLDIWR